MKDVVDAIGCAKTEVGHNAEASLLQIDESQTGDRVADNHISTAAELVCHIDVKFLDRAHCQRRIELMLRAVVVGDVAALLSLRSKHIARFHLSHTAQLIGNVQTQFHAI